jgi:hypothetical protein
MLADELGVPLLLGSRSLSLRDMHGMILDDVAGGYAESPGRSSGGL